MFSCKIVSELHSKSIEKVAVLLHRNVKGVPFVIKDTLHGIQKGTRLDLGAEPPHRETL